MSSAVFLLLGLAGLSSAQQGGLGTSDSGFQDGQLETPWVSTITSIEPRQGSIYGGTRVTIHGKVGIRF